MTNEATGDEKVEVMEAAEPAAVRQTASYLRSLLEANGLLPRRQLGQNFLIDLNILDLLVRESGVTSEDVVLEVGAGTGSLTTRLSAAAARVVAVEIDPGFYRLVAHTTSHLANVTLVRDDALAGKNKINPVLLDAVRQAMNAEGVANYRLIANLPYDVATSVIANLLLVDEPRLRSMTVTIQFEMAQRLMAKPGSKDYGPISVLINRLGKPRWVRLLPPTVFWPRPNVRSAIVHVDFPAERRGDTRRLRDWHRFVRDLFLHRRKTLRSAIASIPGLKETKPHLDGLLSSLGFAAGVRAEELSVRQLEQLYDGVLTLPGRCDFPATSPEPGPSR